MAPELAGAAYALATAFAWAIAVLLFKRSGEQIDSVGLNVLKNIVGLLLLGVTLVATGLGAAPLTLADTLILLASGVAGIAIADTLFFYSLNLLGAGRSAIVDCLYAPLVVLFSVAFLDERVTWHEIAGGALIVGSVALATTTKGAGDLSRRAMVTGVLCGALAMMFTAASIIAAKPVIERLPVPLTSSLRMAGGVLGLTLAAVLHRPTRRSTLAALAPQPVWRFAIPGAVAGSYLAIVLWVAGFKYATASAAGILNQTSTVLIVLLAAIFLRERLTPARVLAAGLAFLGSALVVL